MTRSGCSQGSPVPADTPQEGVRSVRVGREYLMGRLVSAMKSTELFYRDNNHAGLARAAQVVADTARALAEREGE